MQAGNPTLAEPVLVDQSVAPDDFGNGVMWEKIATVTLADNQTELLVQLSDAANGYVIADAIRVASFTPGEITVSEQPDLADPIELVDAVSLVDFGYT